MFMVKVKNCLIGEVFKESEVLCTVMRVRFLVVVLWYFCVQAYKVPSMFCSTDARSRNMCFYCTAKVSLMRSVCKSVFFCVNIGASERLKK